MDYELALLGSSREIEMTTEFAQIFNSSSIVSPRCVLLIAESSKEDTTTIDSDLGHPSSFVEVDTLVRTLAVFTLSSILAIVCMIAFPKVSSAVVQCVMVLVIHFLSGISAHYDAVHSHATSPENIVSIGAGAEPCNPVPSHQPFIIDCIDNRVLPLRKWDQTVRWVRWLSNCMALYYEARAGHVPTSNRNVLLSHFTFSESGVQ